MIRTAATALLIALAGPAAACETQWCPPSPAAAPPAEAAQAAPAPRRERYRRRATVRRPAPQVLSSVSPRAIADAIGRYRYLTAAASIALAGEPLRSPRVTAAELITAAIMPLPAPIDIREPADWNEIDLLAVSITEPGELNEIDLTAPPPKPADRSAIIAGGIAVLFFIVLALIVRGQITRDETEK